MTIDTAISIITFAIVIIGGLVTYFIRRRGTTGEVKTSDAATLWDQSQSLMKTLIEQKEKAETQRDRLIQIQSEQVVPALTAVNDALGRISAAINELLNRDVVK